MLLLYHESFGDTRGFKKFHLIFIAASFFAPGEGKSGEEAQTPPVDFTFFRENWKSGVAFLEERGYTKKAKWHEVA
ncbi:MAG: hypothetical protein LUG45_06525 [Clostridiales bacterium]|nr:hypothetical protein [Clostridiales bacterium]